MTDLHFASSGDLAITGGLDALQDALLQRLSPPKVWHAYTRAEVEAAVRLYFEEHQQQTMPPYGSPLIKLLGRPSDEAAEGIISAVTDVLMQERDTAGTPEEGKDG